MDALSAVSNGGVPRYRAHGWQAWRWMYRVPEDGDLDERANRWAFSSHSAQATYLALGRAELTITHVALAIASHEPPRKSKRSRQ
jgi:hypothetical protein